MLSKTKVNEKSRANNIPIRNTPLASLKHSFNMGRLAHAYLVIGTPRGNAKHFAEQVLAMLYCVSTGDRPCGNCSGCRRAVEHTHPDLMWVEPKKKSRGILVDQVHAIREHVFQTAFEGGWTSVVLVNADRMNEQASNTLLKTLEEPPEKNIFLLLTDLPEALLPTVVSRCQRVVLTEMQQNEVAADGTSFAPTAKRAEANEIDSTKSDDETFRSTVIDIVTGIQGNSVIIGIERARRLLDFLKDVRKRIETSEKKNTEIEKMDINLREDMKTVIDARVEACYREARNAVLGWLLNWYRDVLLCVCGLDKNVYYFPEESQLIHAMARELTCHEALCNIRIIEDMKSQLNQHLAENMVFERGMMRLARAHRRKEGGHSCPTRTGKNACPPSHTCKIQAPINNGQ